METKTNERIQYRFGVTVEPPKEGLVDKAAQSIRNATIVFRKEMMSKGYDLPPLDAWQASAT